MTTYEKNIVTAFQDLCKLNGGASPHEVTTELAKRGQLSELDTVIDIADQMKNLRGRGLL
jgi:hypothetical protein